MNKKTCTALLLAFAFLLAACAPGVELTPTLRVDVPTPAPTQPVCNAVPSKPTPVPGSDSLFPAVGAGEWTKGPADAAVTVILYDDFQCVECNDRVLSALSEAHPKDVRLVYRHYPQPDRYDKSYLAAQAAEAAGRQERFWDMHDVLFAKQSEWISLSPDAFKPWAAREAEEIGLDRARFEADFDDPAVLAKIKKAEADAQAAGIPVLPLVLINGEIYYGPTDYNAFDQMTRLLALGKRQFSSCPEMSIDPHRQYLARLQTEKGEIVIELYADKAPLTVNSFIFLARQGWYDGVTFHRVISGFVAQAGDPSGTGAGGPGYLFRNEISPSLKFDQPGMVGMANSGPGTNGSQFFITFSAQPSLDGAYTIFGRVISGMDALQKLTPRDPGSDAVLADGDLILRVVIEEH